MSTKNLNQLPNGHAEVAEVADGNSGRITRINNRDAEVAEVVGIPGGTDLCDLRKGAHRSQRSCRGHFATYASVRDSETEVYNDDAEVAEVFNCYTYAHPTRTRTRRRVRKQPVTDLRNLCDLCTLPHSTSSYLSTAGVSIQPKGNLI